MNCSEVFNKSELFFSTFLRGLFFNFAIFKGLNQISGLLSREDRRKNICMWYTICIFDYLFKYITFIHSFACIDRAEFSTFSSSLNQLRWPFGWGVEYLMNLDKSNKQGKNVISKRLEIYFHFFANFTDWLQQNRHHFPPA